MHIITSATLYIKYLFHTHIYNTTHFFSLFLLFQHFQTEIWSEVTPFVFPIFTY